MQRIAIISFNHEESTLCLAKYISKLGYAVDYYYINRPGSRGNVPGFEFWRAKVHWGVQELKKSEIPEISDYMNGLDVRLFLITYDTSRRYSIPRIDMFTLWKACRLIRRRQYDAIDIVGQVDYVQYCHKFLRGENITHTFHEVGSHFNNIPTSPSVMISIKDHSKVILHSLSTLKRYVSIPEVDKEKVAVIPFGKFETLKLYARDIDLKLPLDLSKPSFLFIGRIVPYKGIDTLVQAMNILKPLYAKFNLIVAGDGKDPALSYFESLPNCFVYNQFLGNDEMLFFIKQCSVVLFPYHTASQTGIIPTITLYDKPSVATSVGAFPEMIDNGTNGLLVEKENPNAFAEAMRRLIESPELVRSLSKGASQFGSGDDYDWDIIANKTIKFILDTRG